MQLFALFSNLLVDVLTHTPDTRAKPRVGWFGSFFGYAAVRVPTPVAHRRTPLGFTMRSAGHPIDQFMQPCKGIEAVYVLSTMALGHEHQHTIMGDAAVAQGE